MQPILSLAGLLYHIHIILCYIYYRLYGISYIIYYIYIMFPQNFLQQKSQRTKVRSSVNGVLA